jgi:hypothetical protein
MVGLDELFEGLTDRFELKVIMYVRRQDDYISSAWQQWFVKEYPDFLTFVLQNVPDLADWRRIIQPWLERFGRECLDVRLFEPTRFVGGSLLADFAHAAGVDVSGGETSFGNINVSYNNTVTEIASDIRDLFDGVHDNSFYDMMYRMVGPPSFKKPGEHMLSSRQRSAMVSRYSESNRWLRETFFPRSDLPEFLFSEDFGQAQTGAGKSDQDLKLELMGRWLYGQQKLIDAIRAEPARSGKQ